MIEPNNLHDCSNCGNMTFKLQIDDEYNVILYECVECGYIHTHWFEIGEMI